MSFCLYTIPMINQNNGTFIAFADTNVTVLIHWLQLGAFTHCVFLYMVFSRILIFHEPLFSYHEYKTPSTVNATIFFYYFLLPFTLFQPLLGNVTLLQGSRRFFFAVTPKETSFSKPGDVPDYLNEVSAFCLTML